MQISWLKGDYAGAGHHQREEQAHQDNCSIVIEFHFNSNGSTAKGGEIWYQPHSQKSKALATAMWNGFVAIGLPPHGAEPIKAAVHGTRAAWIPFYPCPTILLEPLYVSNPQQANWIHNIDNLKKLAKAISDVIKANAPADAVIGLSIGHKFKESSPDDKGSACALGDFEADHGEHLAHAVASLIQDA